jgi:NAD(P) transhydrogenase subunit beta
MPGHRRLVSEAGVPYDMIEDMEDINPQFKQTDVAHGDRANDVVVQQLATSKSINLWNATI